MIESFEIDHTKIKAPMIRQAKEQIRNNVTIAKYDLRFITPNTSYFDDKTMHSMEHLLATSFKKEFEYDMIDLSPMGCKTGFYFIVFKCENMEQRIKKAIAEAKDIEIPTPTQKNCGSYMLHNIEGARCVLERISELL